MTWASPQVKMGEGGGERRIRKEEEGKRKLGANRFRTQRPFVLCYIESHETNTSHLRINFSEEKGHP